MNCVDVPVSYFDYENVTTQAMADSLDCQVIFLSKRYMGIRRGTRKMLFVFTQFLLGLLTLPVKVDVAYKERYIHVNIRTACTL